MFVCLCLLTFSRVLVCTSAKNWDNRAVLERSLVRLGGQSSFVTPERRREFRKRAGKRGNCFLWTDH